MQAIRSVIVEDEYQGRELLVNMIRAYCPSLTIQAVFGNIPEAADHILGNPPDLIFLDVDLPPHGTGFDLLEILYSKGISCPVIFTTGLPEYAIRAFRAQAIDFLLKPIDQLELKEAVQRACHMSELRDLRLLHDKFGALLHNISGSSHRDGKILVRSSRIYRQLRLRDIGWCQGLAQQTSFHCFEGEIILSSEPIDSYQDYLLTRGFIQAKRYILVNLEHVEYYADGPRKASSGKIILTNGDTIEVSRRQRDHVLKRLHDASQGMSDRNPS